ncbi:MAG: glycine--tRNA ligase [Candidatus Marsarchaeota archaeon]|nr:glycine--tRNA ligase [Candidatus Marsarchaeota archaeon]
MNIEDVMALAKRKGIFAPTAEIYGGAAGLYDYGHVGAAIKRKFESVWMAYFVERMENYHMIDGSTVLPEKPLVASGHAALFNDILVGCTKCNTYFRADVLLKDSGIDVSEGASAAELDDAISKNKVICPKCKGAFGKARAFNMMFDLYLGPERNEKAYLRPETAQSVYLNFFREFSISKKKLPLGLAIVGKAYRNEISPRQGLYRLRELTQAELQIFFDPDNWNLSIEGMRDMKLNVAMYANGGRQESISIKDMIERYSIPQFYAFHMGLINTFYTDVIGISSEHIRFYEKGGNEKAFYNKLHMDIEVDVESWGGFKEVGGLHYRTDYDLKAHSKGSGQDLSVMVGSKKLMPNVLELSFGVDRNVWMMIDRLYEKTEARSVLRLPKFLAPTIAGIFPLQHEEALVHKARELYLSLKPILNVEFDMSGSIGRRYARMDEIGTPFCITIDYDTVDKSSERYDTVTLRNMEDKSQTRMKISDIAGVLLQESRFDPSRFSNISNYAPYADDD